MRNVESQFFVDNRTGLRIMLKRRRRKRRRTRRRRTRRRRRRRRRARKEGKYEEKTRPLKMEVSP